MQDNILLRNRFFYNFIKSKIIFDASDIEGKIENLNLIKKLGSFAWRNHPGCFFDAEIENLLLAYGHKLEDYVDINNISQSINNVFSTQVNYTTLHIATEIADVGGHTRIINQIIKRSKELNQHFILTGNDLSCVPEWFKKSTQEFATISSLKGFETHFEKAFALRLLSKRFKRIIIYTHPYDILPTIAFAEKNRIPVAVDNHAHSWFWYGKAIADLIFCHTEYHTKFTKKYRKPDRCFHLSFAQIDKLDDLPGIEEKAKAKESLNIDKNKTVILSVATREKFIPNNEYNFFELLEGIVTKYPNVICIVVGLSDSDILLKDMTKNERIIFHPVIKDLTYFYLASDICLEAMPQPSLGVQLQAPLVGLSCPIPKYGKAKVFRRYFPGNVSLYEQHFSKEMSKNQFLDKLDLLINNEQLRIDMAKQIRESLQKFKSDDVLYKNLKDLYSTIDSLNHTPRLQDKTLFFDDEENIEIAERSELQDLSSVVAYWKNDLAYDDLSTFSSIDKISTIYPAGNQRRQMISIDEKPIYQLEEPSDKLIKAIAFYLPQYHPIPENDQWWGKGFTEWTNVAKAKPLFPGHYQPRIPADLGFYDLRLTDVREAQAELARQSGISGFCYYHYWFNGKLLLERPLQEVLKSGKPDFPFCMCWANENWTRIWDGSENKILIKQDYNEQDDMEHIRFLCRMFRDPRYIRIQGKPLFLVYRANKLPEPLKTTTAWREEAQKLGIGDLYLCRVESFPDEHADPSALGFDASVEFQPDWTMLGPNLDAPLYKDLLVFNYRDIVNRMLAKPEPSYLRFPCVTPSWDNSPRRKKEAGIIVGSSPRHYEFWLNETIRRTQARPDHERIVFINAWNEWGEGNHLEPDIKYGRAYLEATKRALSNSAGQVIQATELSDQARAGGRLDYAEGLLMQSLYHNPDEPHLLHKLGLIKYQQGITNEAIKLLEQAYSIESIDSEIINDLGALYFEAGNNEDAEVHFIKAIELDDTMLDARKNLLDLLIASGRLEEAEDACKEILDRYPDDTEVISLRQTLKAPSGDVADSLPQPDKNKTITQVSEKNRNIYGLKPINSIPLQQNQPGKIAVHLHLYYIDMADELLPYFANIPFTYDLFITVTDKDAIPLIEQKSQKLCGSQLANLYVNVIPNRGRDIAAFFVTLQSCYKKYDYLCHVHSKKSIYSGTVRTEWCHYLFESLFKDEDYLRRIFTLFAKDSKVGIVYPTTSRDMPYWCHSWLSNNRSSSELFSRLGITVDTRYYIDYPVGSMLWARSNALEPLFNLNLKFDDFPAEPIPNDGTLCHAIERTFCISGHLKGYTFVELDIHEGNFLLNDGKKNLWQYWARSSDHLLKTLQQYHTISFDVFDTLITRPLLAPDHAFLLVQHKIEQELGIKFNFFSLRKKAEALVREKLKPGEDAALGEIYEYFEKITELPSETVNRIKHIEVDNEIALALPRDGMAELVTRLRGEGRKIVYLSDMYLPSDIIRDILAHTGVAASENQILVSSETGIRKDTGAVWQQYLQNIAQYHIGDNEHSDIQLATDNGIGNYHVMSPNRLFELGQPRSYPKHVNTLGNSIYAGPVVARLFSSPFAMHETSGHFHIDEPMELGYCVFGPVLLYFTTWLYKRSRELGIEHLLFLAREGYLLQELFKIFSEYFGGDDIQTSYLLCSRRANSVPTIERESDILSILEAPYEGTLYNLLESRYGLNIEADNMLDLLSPERLYDEIINIPKDVNAVYKDILKFKKSIFNHAQKEKSLYLAYLNNLGVLKEKKTAIVDIGFAGTIQKYLQKITGFNIEGFYFITNPNARKNFPANNLHACFGNFVEFGKGNIIYDYSLILESILTAPSGQFMRFDDVDKPVFGKNVYNEETWPLIRSMHLGVIDYFRDVFKWFGDALLTHEPHVDTATQFFRMISQNPLIISKSLRDTMQVDDFYTSNGVASAFNYASQFKKHSLSFKSADLEFAKTYLSKRAFDDHNRFKSKKEFNDYFHSKQHDYEERLLFEKIISNISSNPGSLNVRGYCDCCGKMTTMQSNWNFSDATMNHKAYMYNPAGYADWYGKALLFREHLICEECRLNNRQRGIFYAAKAMGLDLSMLDVYAYEQVTRFYTALEKMAKTAVGSEFLGDQCRPGELYDGIRHEDALHLSFADNSFDLMISNDVFEHVPDIEKAFREASRVLKPGGILLFSVPFDLSINETVRRAQIGDGKIDHILEPVYHGNPVSDDGSLVFYDYGWNIIDLCKNSGFDNSFMLYYYSPNHMLLGGGLQFVFAGIKSAAAKGKSIAWQPETIKDGDSSSTSGNIDRRDSKPEEKPQVSIIIPLYNNSTMTRACLASIGEHTAKHRIELILIDNASTDETPQLLKTLSPDVRVIHNKTNLGFARACNQGAMAAKGDYLLFLNNDTTVTNGWLDPLLDTIQKPGIGIVGCKMLYSDGRIQHAGISFINGVPDHPYRYENANHPDTCSATEMDMVTGACFMISKELFINLNGFDEIYKNGVEDVDLCLRVREAGYRVIYQPETVIFHHEGQTVGRFNHVKENLSIFFKRWQNSFDKNGRFKISSKKRLTPSQKSVVAESQPCVIWEGSQFVHHSLAQVNRELCLRLIEKGCDVSIIPYEKDQFGPKQAPRFKPIAKRTNKKLHAPVDVHVRHQWPPKFDPPSEGHWVIIQPWEFGSLPREWISHMSAGVDEIWVPSNFVRDCYIQSGIPSDRVFVVPNGVDINLYNPGTSPYKLKTKKKFKFLFVGGTIYRKGIDVLLDVYIKNFSAKDDVCLVIKDMGGQSFYKDRTAKEIIRKFQSEPGAPEIEYIEHTLKFSEIAGLYRACDCLVHPYRGEGFGLPIAEAMASGCPVIVTGYGAALDFCSEDNAYLIPSKIVQLPEKQIGEMETVDFPWLAEPDKEEMSLLMKYVFEHPEEAATKGQACADFIQANFTWDHAAAAAIARISQLKTKPIVRFSQVKNSVSRSLIDIEEKASILTGNTSNEANINIMKERVKKLLCAGEECFSKGEFKNAVENFKLVLQLDPHNAQALNNLGVIQCQLGDPVGAIKTFQNALTKNPEDDDALGNLIQTSMETGRFDIVDLSFLETLQGLHPENSDLNILINEYRNGSSSE